MKTHVIGTPNKKIWYHLSTGKYSIDGTVLFVSPISSYIAIFLVNAISSYLSRHATVKVMHAIVYFYVNRWRY